MTNSRMKNIFVFVVCLFLSWDGLQARENIATDWDLYYGRNVTPVIGDDVGFVWKNSNDIPPNAQKIDYKRTFLLSDRSLSKKFDTLILGPFWGQVKVTINGNLLLDELNDGVFPGRIFSRRLVHIPNNILAHENVVVLETKADKMLGGFRESEVIFENSKNLRSWLWLNYFLNDAHVFFALLSLVIGVISLWLSIQKTADSFSYLMLAFGSLGVIPHHLLATEFYGMFTSSLTEPFALQLAAQTLAWPSFCLFFLCQSHSGGHEINARIVSYFKAKPGHLWLPPTLFTLLSIAMPFQYYAFAAYPFLLMSGMTAIGAVITSDRKSSFYWYFVVGAALIMTSLASDLLSMNLYLLGCGTAVFSAGGLAKVVREFSEAHHRQLVFSSLVKKSLPVSVHVQIEKLLEKKMTFLEISSATTGNTTLSTVLIDICDWGTLNNYSVSQIPAGIIYAARTVVFNEVESIMSAAGMDLIKTSGDNMKFTGGLFQDFPNKEKRLAALTLQTIARILDELPRINGVLRDKNLPQMKIKISATMGLCDYALEEYGDRLQFDTQGHWVNVAYRQESAMDARFYEQYGKNVAIISTSIISQCDDIELLSRFPQAWQFEDKHHFRYDCYIGREAKTDVNLEAFASSMFGFFSHETSPSADDLKAGELLDGSEVQVQSGGLAQVVAMQIHPETKEFDVSRKVGAAHARRRERRKIYIGEKVEAELECALKNLSGECIDATPFGIGMVVNVDHVGDLNLVGQAAMCRIQLDEQLLNVNCTIATQSPFHSKRGNFIRLGVAFNHEIRESSERKWRRSSVQPDFGPIASCFDRLGAKNVTFKVSDLSASGLCLTTIDEKCSLIPGITVEFKLLFPGLGEQNFKGNIRYAFACANGMIKYGVLPTDRLTEFQAFAAKYLASFGEPPLTFSELKQSGYRVDGLKHSVSYAYVETDDEFKEVLALRLKVWQSSGKFKNLNDSTKMGDEFDTESRHLICRVAGKVVAAARVIYNGNTRGVTELGTYGYQFPDWLKNEKFVEMSRVVVDEEYRGEDIFLGMLHHLGRITIQSGHRYILQSCSDGLFGIYSRFGFRRIGSFDGDGERWNVALLDLEKALKGREAGTSLGWTLALGKLAKELKKKDYIQSSTIDSAMSLMNDAMSPIVNYVYRRRKRSGEKKAS
jgi:predicted GNAT family N-acyltransferase